MKFYHRTTEDNWRLIQEEGCLWGMPQQWDDEQQRWRTIYRHTYVSSWDWGESYGPVLLEIEYTPYGDRGVHDNCNMDSEDLLNKVRAGIIGVWQFSIYNPISLTDVKRIDKAPERVFEEGWCS